ncbi:MAG TPA: response regulator [Phycisphaerae bacterium]|nr:response regulator [Phycisphaerae bacterium]
MPKILLVDDDAACVGFLRRLLADCGHEVAAFQSGHEATAEGAAFEPDLLITDWLLKDHMDGAAIVASLRERYPALPAIIISGLPKESLRVALERLGNAVLVEKPIDFDHLVGKIEGVLSGTVQAAHRHGDNRSGA